MSSLTSSDAFRADTELLEPATRLLLDEGFAVDEVSHDAGDFLLFENRFFIVALAATATLSDLLRAEPIVDAYLRRRLAEADVGPKIWDAYLVLITQERALDEGAGLHPLFAINYDTKGLRRIARTGVEPTTAGVRGALAPFVEPLMLAGAGLPFDSLEAFESALVSEGVVPELARRAIGIFTQGGRLEDAV